jgi:hypothetical protein
MQHRMPRIQEPNMGLLLIGMVCDMTALRLTYGGTVWYSLAQWGAQVSSELKGWV